MLGINMNLNEILKISKGETIRHPLKWENIPQKPFSLHDHHQSTRLGKQRDFSFLPSPTTLPG